MPTVKVLPKGQITLPKEIRKKMDIREGDSLLMDTDGSQATTKKGKTIFDFKGALPNLGMSIDEIREKAVAKGFSLPILTTRRISGESKA